METHANLENYDFNIAYNFLRKYDGQRLATGWLFNKISNLGPHGLFNVLIDVNILVGEGATNGFYNSYRFYRVKLK